MNIKMNFIAAGYYLKYIRDNELYLEDGYKTIWEFAEDNYGIKRTTASRWMLMNDRFSVDGNTPTLAEEYRAFGKSQLQEMLYLEDEQIEQVTPEMTVKEIREVREPELDPEEEPVSVLGYPLRVYPEESLIATPGCGKQDCFSCHRDGCELRQVECYCVEAPMGNPFPCTTLNVVENLRDDIGNQCQFVNEDLAFHRAGDGQPVPCCKRCNNPCGYECNRSVNARYEKAEQEKEKMCDVAHEQKAESNPEKSSCPPDVTSCIRNQWGHSPQEQHEGQLECAKCWNAYKERKKILEASKEPSEEQIPGQMSLEDYPELLPDQEESDINIDNGEDNAVNEQTETVVDAEYKEVAAEMKKMRKSAAKKAADLDELTFSEIAIRDYLEEEERTLAEYEKVNSEDGGLPHNLMMRQRMLVKALRLLMENKADQDEQEDDEPEEIFLKGKEFMSCARNSLSNINLEVEHKAWKAALASAGYLTHYLGLVVDMNTDQPELPAMKNNDQRKEWLKNYKDWGIWYRDENIDVNYYKYDFSDGSRLVVAEYPHRRMYWNPNEFEDEHYYHLLDKNRKYYGSDKTFEQQYVNSTDSETSLVEFLKNLQKGEKK